MSSFVADSDSDFDSDALSQDDKSSAPFKTELGAPRYNNNFLRNLLGNREELYNVLQSEFQLALPNKEEFLEKLFYCIRKTEQVEEEYQLENACNAIECICDANTSVASFKNLAQEVDSFSKQEDLKEVEGNVLASLFVVINDVHVQTYFQGNTTGEGTLTIYIVDEHTSVAKEYIDEIKDVMDELGYPKESLSMDQIKNFNNFLFLNLISAEGDCEQYLGYEALKRHFYVQ